VFASSNDSDQTGCLGGGGEAYGLERNGEHAGSLAGEGVGVNGVGGLKLHCYWPAPSIQHPEPGHRRRGFKPAAGKQNRLKPVEEVFRGATRFNAVLGGSRRIDPPGEWEPAT